MAPKTKRLSKAGVLEAQAFKAAVAVLAPAFDVPEDESEAAIGLAFIEAVEVIRSLLATAGRGVYPMHGPVLYSAIYCAMNGLDPDDGSPNSIGGAKVGALFSAVGLLNRVVRANNEVSWLSTAWPGGGDALWGRPGDFVAAKNIITGEWKAP
jgi:hypothetical protein